MGKMGVVQDMTRSKSGKGGGVRNDENSSGSEQSAIARVKGPLDGQI